jgi:hypothetical protein
MLETRELSIPPQLSGLVWVVKSHPTIYILFRSGDTAIVHLRKGQQWKFIEHSQRERLSSSIRCIIGMSNVAREESAEATASFSPWLDRKRHCWISCLL